MCVGGIKCLKQSLTHTNVLAVINIDRVLAFTEHLVSQLLCWALDIHMFI